MDYPVTPMHPPCDPGPAHDRDRDVMLRVVPLGYPALYAKKNEYTPITLSDLRGMVNAFPKDRPAYKKDENTQSCWFCMDVFLKLFAFNHNQKELQAKTVYDDRKKAAGEESPYQTKNSAYNGKGSPGSAIFNDPDVSGVRIYFAASGKHNTVVVVATRAVNIDGVITHVDRVDNDEMVLYVDENNRHLDGGSLCPPLGGSKL